VSIVYSMIALNILYPDPPTIMRAPSERWQYSTVESVTGYVAPGRGVGVGAGRMPVLSILYDPSPMGKPGLGNRTSHIFAL